MTEQFDTDHSLPRALMWVLLAVLALSKGFGAALGALASPETMADGAVYYGIAIGQELLFFGLPAFLLRHRFPILRARTNAACPPLALAALALLAALHQVALQYLTQAWSALLQLTGLTLYAAAAPLPTNVFQLILAGLAMVLLPALCEEGLFRGALYPGLLGALSRRGAVAAVTLLFACLHGSLTALPAHLTAGLMLTLIVARTGSLTAAMLYHGVYNGLSLLLSMTWSDWMIDAARSPAAFLIVLALLACASVAGAVLFFKRQSSQPEDGGLRPDRSTVFLIALALLGMACFYLADIL